MDTIALTVTAAEADLLLDALTREAARCQDIARTFQDDPEIPDARLAMEQRRRAVDALRVTITQALEGGG